MVVVEALLEALYSPKIEKKNWVYICCIITCPYEYSISLSLFFSEFVNPFSCLVLNRMPFKILSLSRTSI